MIATNVIIIWPGTNASIPSGYTRVTDLDGRYPKGADALADPNATGGSATHSHDSAANHSHNMNSHGHACTLYQIGADGSDSDSGGSELTQGHVHYPTISGVVGGSLTSVAATYALVNQEPPYYSPIFIKSTGKRPIPPNAVVLWYDNDMPTGFLFCDGANGTPDLRNKYLKGAAAGADAGATGGALTHNHDLTHTHTENTHYHSQVINEAGNVDGGGRRGRESNGRARLVHYHLVTFNSSSAGSISTVSLTCAENHEPAYKKLIGIKNASGNNKIPKKGVIGMWLGSLATIPVGWKLCDGNNGTPDMRSLHLKLCNTVGEKGNTGGSNTHTHASQGHSHTGGSHGHSWNSGSSNLRHDYNISGAQGVGGGWGILNKDHAHDNCHTIQNAAASWDTQYTSAQSVNSEPPYRTVCFIMLKNPSGMMAQEN